MRLLSLLAILIGLALPGPAGADETKRFENPDQKLAFEYPAPWSLATDQARGLLPNERFEARTSGAPRSGFAVAVYQLDAPLDNATFAPMLQKLDQQASGWIAKLPNASIGDRYDVVLDGADGREYVYRYVLDGQLVSADTLVAVFGDRAVEVSRWAPEAEYAARAPVFDAVFASLVLPWTASGAD